MLTRFSGGICCRNRPPSDEDAPDVLVRCPAAPPGTTSADDGDGGSGWNEAFADAAADEA